MAKKSAVKAAAPEAAKEPVLSPLHELLQHVAESEHALRHPDAFKELVEKAGFKLAKLPHKLEVQDKS